MRNVILIVEDDEQNLKLIKALLKINGYSTLVATNGKQGVEIAKNHKPNLILMDVRMPVMDGFEATKILKAGSETKDIPIIVLTAFAMEGDKEKVLKAGCDGYISKPFDVEVFLKTVGEFFQTK